MSTYTTLPKVSTLVTQKLEHYLNDARIEENFDRTGKLKLSTNFPRREIQELKREYFKAYAVPEEEKKKQYLKSLEEQERERQQKDLERLAEELQLESESKRPVSKKSTKSLKSSKSVSGKSYTSYKSYSSYYTTKSTIKSIGLPAIVPQKPVPIRTGKINPILYDFPRRKTTFTEAERVAVSANDIYTKAELKEIQHIYRYREKDHSLYVDSPEGRNTYRDPAMKFRLHLHFGTILKAPKLCKDFSKIHETDEKDGEEADEGGASVGVDGSFKDILPKKGGDTSHLNAMLGLDDQESEEDNEDDGKPVIIEVESDPGKISDDEVKSTTSRGSRVSRLSKHSRSSKASTQQVDRGEAPEKAGPEASKAPTSAEESTLPSKVQSESTTRRASVEETGYERDFESVSSKTGSKSLGQDRKKVRKHRKSSQGSRGSTTSTSSTSSKGTLSKSKEPSPAPESLKLDAKMSKESIENAGKKSDERKVISSSSSSSTSTGKAALQTPVKQESGSSGNGNVPVAEKDDGNAPDAENSISKNKGSSNRSSKKSSVASQKSGQNPNDETKDSSNLNNTEPTLDVSTRKSVEQSEGTSEKLDESQETPKVENVNETTSSSESGLTRESVKINETGKLSALEEEQKPVEQKTPLLEVISQAAEENEKNSNEGRTLDSTDSLYREEDAQNYENTLDSTANMAEAEEPEKESSQVDSSEHLEKSVEQVSQPSESLVRPPVEVEIEKDEKSNVNILTDEMLMHSSQTLDAAASSSNTLNGTNASSKPDTPQNIEEPKSEEKEEQPTDNLDVPAKGMYDYTPGSTSDFYASGATTPSTGGGGGGGQDKIAGGLEEDT